VFLDILDRHMPAADRLNITCNGDSVLAQHAGPKQGQQRTVVLPQGAHDQGFAMTTSFTTMLLTVLACLDDMSPALVKTTVETLAHSAAQIIPAAEDFARKRLPFAPERAVFPVAVYATSRPLRCLRFARNSGRLRRLAAHGRPRCARMGVPSGKHPLSGARRFACPSLRSGSGALAWPSWAVIATGRRPLPQ
jgi:hypothetical protein